MLLIITFILLGAICLLELQTIERQKREIKAGEEAYRMLADKYRKFSNTSELSEEQHRVVLKIEGKTMEEYLKRNNVLQ